MKKILILLAMILAISCGKSALTPHDESRSKGHDDWSRVEIIITEGELKNGDFYPYQKLDNSKYKIVQKVEYKKERQVDEYGNETFPIKKSGDLVVLQKDKYYALEINYYNNNGLINEQFTSPKNAKIHQHFFISRDNKNQSLADRTKAELIDYVYRDKDKNDPIGLRGYFKVISEERETELVCILVHFSRNKIAQGKSKPYPFYHFVKNESTDFQQGFEVKVVKSPATVWGLSQEELNTANAAKKTGTEKL